MSLFIGVDYCGTALWVLGYFLLWYLSCTKIWYDKVWYIRFILMKDMSEINGCEYILWFWLLNLNDVIIKAGEW